MIKKFTYFIYKTLIFFDCIIYKLFKKNFRYFLYDFLRNSSYETIKINEKSVKFFVPSSIVKERVKKIFIKEPDTIEWINSFSRFSIDQNTILWDIGANIGLFSIYASTQHKDLNIFAFEPSMNNLSILTRNVSINNLVEKITVNQFPLTDKKNKYLKLKESNFVEGGALNTFGEEYDYEGKDFKENNSYKVFGTSIDYLIDEKILDVPDFIKIDVDGIEHLILDGAKKLLKEKRLKSIQIELNENFEFQNQSCTDTLISSGFKLKTKNLASSRRSKSLRFSKMYNCVFERT